MNMNNMIVYSSNKLLFKELEQFLYFYYSDTKYPISIQKPLLNQKQIVYNTEQLCRPDLADFIESIKNNDYIHEVWDYSQINIDILNKHGIYHTKHIPLKIWPEYKNKILSFNTHNIYSYDIGFCGWVYGDHRLYILNQIKLSGLTIDIIDNQYEDARDMRLSKCKILLNIHFDQNYKIFEQYRCFPWLDTKKIVVSENSLDNDPRCVNVDYTHIVPTLKQLLNK